MELKIFEENGFYLTHWVALLHLRPLNLYANFVFNFIIWITNPQKIIGYD